MSKIETHSLNTAGRDYIVSDIHGHFSLLEEEMAKVDFAPDKDRLFSLGDLIDRGDESNRVLDFLRQPWFFAILGNHEMMLLEAFESGDPDTFRRWYYWGGAWAESLSKKQLSTYYEALISLPIAREITLKNRNTIGLVHAELPDQASWDEVRHALAAIDRSAPPSKIYQHGVAALLWSRTQPYRSQSELKRIQPVDQIHHVFHGHTIVPFKPLTVANRTFMDLGSYDTGVLGFIDAATFLEARESAV
jgi:serine/threonine protein phosphatase 1